MSKRVKRLLLVFAVILAVAGLAAFYGLRHDAPEGQQPLTMLDNSSIERLRSDFNAASDHARVIVLLSPT